MRLATFQAVFTLVSLSVLVTVTSHVVINFEAENKLQGQFCASLFTERLFKGRRFDTTDIVPLSSRWVYRRHLNLIPSSVKVAPSCDLTVFDGNRYIQTVQSDTPDLQWPVGRRLHSSCCQCGNCTGMKTLENIECARIFQYEKCSVCIGSHLNLKDGQEISKFDLLQGRVSSSVVRDGCKLTATYEVQHLNWKLSLNADLKTGDNFIEHGVFSEEAQVRITKAVCSCQSKPQKLIQPIDPEPTFQIMEHAPASVESVSESAEISYKEFSQSEEDLYPIY